MSKYGDPRLPKRGISQRDYRRLFGSSLSTARAILDGAHR